MAKTSQPCQAAEMQKIVSGMFERQAADMKALLLAAQIPPQVLRQQPVYFEDAHGRLFPFCVEFIDSFAAFQAVLEVRFRSVPGLEKVQRKEYAVEDEMSKALLDLQSQWQYAARPGRRIVMSMVFRELSQETASTCPGCHTFNMVRSGKSGDQIQW